MAEIKHGVVIIACLVAAVQRLIELPARQKTRGGIKKAHLPNIVQLLLL